MTPGTAAEVYCILTVGDGLVSQIPALLITLSAGVLTTRVASKDVSQTLGGNLQEELLSSPKVLAIGASFALALGLVPGLPLLPFMAISGALAFFAWRGYRATQAVAESQEQGQLQLEAHRRQEKLKAQRTDIDDAAPAVVPVGIDCSPELSEALGISADSDSELLMLLKEVRRHLYVQIGVRYPPANVRTHVSNLRGHQYCIRIKDVPVFQGSFDPGKVMAVESPTRLKRMGLEAEPFVHPIQGTQVSLVPVSMQEALNEVGVTTWSAAGVIALQVAHQLGKRATVFLGLHETSDMLERLDRAYPSLVREVVPKIVSTAQLADILRRLVDEGVSVRDLKTILESLAELGTIDMDPVEVTEHVRAGLALQLAHAYAGLGGKLKVVNLDPLFEDMVRAGVTRVRGGTTLVLAPEIREALLTAVHRALRPVVTSGERVVLMAGADVRRYVRMLVRGEHDVAVLSPMELPEDIGLTLLGTVTLPDELPDAA
jgi:type III secretion protein V